MTLINLTPELSQKAWDRSVQAAALAALRKSACLLHPYKNVAGVEEILLKIANTAANLKPKEYSCPVVPLKR